MNNTDLAERVSRLETWVDGIEKVIQDLCESVMFLRMVYADDEKED